MLELVLASSLALAAATPAGAARSARPVVRTTAAPVLPFIENDLPRAVALAKARKVPIFVEAWAPW